MNILPFDLISKEHNRNKKEYGQSLDTEPAKYFGIRPEHIEIVQLGKGQHSAIVDVIEYMGADTFIIMDAGDLGGVTVRCSGNSPYESGIKVGLNFKNEKILLFNKDGDRL